MTKTKTAAFALGQVVRHRLFGYRGIIYDVDPVYSQSPEWFDMMARSNAPLDRPWYHVLVDGETHTTYVAEENLMMSEETGQDFDHPLLHQIFQASDSGELALRACVN